MDQDRLPAIRGASRTSRPATSRPTGRLAVSIVPAPLSLPSAARLQPDRAVLSPDLSLEAALLHRTFEDPRCVTSYAASRGCTSRLILSADSRVATSRS